MPYQLADIGNRPMSNILDRVVFISALYAGEAVIITDLLQAFPLVGHTRNSMHEGLLVGLHFAFVAPYRDNAYSSSVIRFLSSQPGTSE